LAIHMQEIQGHVKERCAQLTDDDLQTQGRNLDQLIKRILQERGEGREAIETFLADLTLRSSSVVAHAAEAAGRYAHQAVERARDRYENAERGPLQPGAVGGRGQERQPFDIAAEAALPGRMTLENSAENTEKSIAIWDRLISNETRALPLTMGWGGEGQGGPAARGFAREGFFHDSHHRSRSQVMSKTSDKVKKGIHGATEKVKDAAHNVAEKAKDVVHNVGEKIKDVGR